MKLNGLKTLERIIHTFRIAVRSGITHTTIDGKQVLLVDVIETLEDIADKL
jgi:hypothetical protein